MRLFKKILMFSLCVTSCLVLGCNKQSSNEEISISKTENVKAESLEVIDETEKTLWKSYPINLSETTNLGVSVTSLQEVDFKIVSKDNKVLPSELIVKEVEPNKEKYNTRLTIPNLAAGEWEVLYKTEKEEELSLFVMKLADYVSELSLEKTKDTKKEVEITFSGTSAFGNKTDSYKYALYIKNGDEKIEIEKGLTPYEKDVKIKIDKSELKDDINYTVYLLTATDSGRMDYESQWTINK